MQREAVTLQAKVVEGVNVTFDWNFCHTERRTSTPHENDENCLEVVCQSDKQVKFAMVFAGIFCCFITIIMNHMCLSSGIDRCLVCVYFV